MCVGVCFALKASVAPIQSSFGEIRAFIIS